MAKSSGANEGDLMASGAIGGSSSVSVASRPFAYLGIATALCVFGLWPSAAHAVTAPCYSNTTWSALPQQAPALVVYQPTFTAGLRPGPLSRVSFAGRRGLLVSYGSLGSDGIVMTAGQTCASGEWGDFDQYPTSERDIQVLGYTARLSVRSGRGGALVTWSVGHDSYLVASHQQPADVVVRFARSLRYRSPRYCVVDTTPLNIRVAPGVQARRVGAIPVGDCGVKNASPLLHLKAAPNGRPWRRIVWRGIEGWVAEGMLRLA